MHQIQDLIHQYHDLFYLITFVWTALEGETFIVFAGLAAQKGVLNVWFLFLAAWLGSMCGDQFFFLWEGNSAHEYSNVFLICNPALTALLAG
jgi:hypothetical protein